MITKYSEWRTKSFNTCSDCSPLFCSSIYFVGIFLVVPVGWALDRYAHRASVILFGTTLPLVAYSILLFTDIHPAVGCLVLVNLIIFPPPLHRHQSLMHNVSVGNSTCSVPNFHLPLRCICCGGTPCWHGLWLAQFCDQSFLVPCACIPWIRWSTLAASCYAILIYFFFFFFLPIICSLLCTRIQFSLLTRCLLTGSHREHRCNGG